MRAHIVSCGGSVSIAQRDASWRAFCARSIAPAGLVDDDGRVTGPRSPLAYEVPITEDTSSFRRFV
jgi:hypothetical protein